MMYYLVKTTIEDNQHTQEIFAYNTEREATSAYHHGIWSAMANDAVRNIMFMVVNSDAVVLRSEKYERIEFVEM